MKGENWFKAFWTNRTYSFAYARWNSGCFRSS